MDYIFMFKKLWKYSKSDHWRVVLYLFLHVLSMLGMLGQPYAFSRIVNALQLNLNYSPLCGESGLKPHSYCN